MKVAEASSRAPSRPTSIIIYDPFDAFECGTVDVIRGRYRASRNGIVFGTYDNEADAREILIDRTRLYRISWPPASLVRGAERLEARVERAEQVRDPRRRHGRAA